MKNGAKKKVTIDDLAMMVAKELEGMRRDLARIENNLIYHIGTVKDHIESVNKRIDDFAETKISKTEFKGLESRVSHLEKK